MIAAEEDITIRFDERERDIIVSFDDQSVNSMSSLKSIMEYYAAGEKVTVQYYHQEGSEYVLKSVEVTLGKKS